MDVHNHKTPLILALVLGLSLGTAGCDKKDEKTTETKEQQGEVVATVNGEAITESELNEYRGLRPSAGGQDDKALIDELVTQKVIYQDALQKKLDEDPEVLKELDLMRTRILASAAVRKTMDEAPISDAELQAEYDKLKDRMVSPEYKASHILVKEEDQARKLIEQLNKGADFAKLAKENSTDPSAKNGGDLGWFNPQQMVPPFSQALVQLEKGSYTKEPVKTQFGWHIIMLEDSRQSEPPALDEIKGRLEQMLKQRKIRDYIQALKDKAQISIKGEEPAVKTDEPAEKGSEAPAPEGENAANPNAE